MAALIKGDGTINRRELARIITTKEGGKRNLNIADVTEVLRLVIEELAQHTNSIIAMQMTLSRERDRQHRAIEGL